MMLPIGRRKNPDGEQPGVACQMTNQPVISSRQYGFTLVEIMAVVFIIGVMLGLASITISGRPERQLQMEAQRIYQKIRLLSEEAEISGVEMGFSLDNQGYQLFRFSEITMKWITLEEGDFKPVVLDSNYRLELDMQGEKLDTDLLYKKENREKATDYGEKNNEEPEVILFSDGQLTPFKLTLTDKNISRLRYIIEGINPARLTVQAYDR